MISPAGRVGTLVAEGCNRRFSSALEPWLDTRFCQMYLTTRLLNWMVHDNMSPDRLSTTFAALADPTRRAILARLIAGETSVTELAEPFEMSLPAVSKHLKVLERAGLIARGQEAD